MNKTEKNLRNGHMSTVFRNMEEKKKLLECKLLALRGTCQDHLFLIKCPSTFSF